MAISLVTDKNNIPQTATNSGMAITSASFPNGTEVGSTLVVCCSHFSLSGNINIADSAGNSYTLAASIDSPSGEWFQFVYYAYSIGGLNTVTATSSNGSAVDLQISEWFGIAEVAVDQAGGNFGTSSVPTNTSVTSNNGELILAYAVGNSTFGAGAGYTVLSETTSFNRVVEYQIQLTAGTATSNFSTSVPIWSVVQVCFIPGTGTRNLQTIDDIATWVVVDQLHRTTADADIVSVSRNAALSFYKILCAKIPFDELMTTSPFFNLIPNRTQYNIGTDFPFNPQLRAISDIQINLGTNGQTNFRRLRRSHVRVFDALSIQPSSYPSTYARWGMQLMFQPPPQQVFPLQFRYWQKPTIVPGALFYTTALITPEEWDELIKWETLFRVYLALDRPEDAMALVQPPMSQMMPGSPRKQTMYQTGIIPRLWNDLLTTASQKENVDEDFSINPVIRPYSMRG